MGRKMPNRKRKFHPKRNKRSHPRKDYRPIHRKKLLEAELREIECNRRFDREVDETNLKIGLKPKFPGTIEEFNLYNTGSSKNKMYIPIPLPECKERLIYDDVRSEGIESWRKIFSQGYEGLINYIERTKIDGFYQSAMGLPIKRNPRYKGPTSNKHLF